MSESTLTAGESRPWSKDRRFGALIEGVALAWVYVLFERLRGLVTGSRDVALRHAQGLFHAEKFLGLNVERSVQQALVHTGWLMSLMSVLYGVVYFVALAVTLIVLYRRDPARYVRWRNTLLIMFGLALLVYWAWPLMPPRLMPASFGFSLPHHSLSVMSHIRTALGGAPSPTKANFWQYGNAYAAMPSFHVASAIWVAAALWPLVRRPYRPLLAAYPLAMVVCVLVTGNHWLLDITGSGILVLTSAMAATAFSNHRPRLKRQSALPVVASD